MFTHQLKKLPKNTFEILVKIPQLTVQDQNKHSFDKLHTNLQVQGFRKGKVPRLIAEKHLKTEDIYQETIKELIPKIYQEVIDKEKINPIVNPKVELIKVKEGEDWEIKFIVAGKPTIELKDYKKTVKNIKTLIKKDDIWVPGKTKEKKVDDEQNKQKLLNEILSALLKESKFEISDLIIEEEISRRLTQLLDDIRKIGLTVEGYLKSKNLTIDEIKKRYSQEINDTYKIEFILQSIADKEEIKVEKADLDKLFLGIKDDKERKSAEQNAYFYASVLRKQKTIDFLLSL